LVVVYVVVVVAVGGDTEYIRTAACRSTPFSSKLVDVSNTSRVLQKHIAIQPSADCVYHIAY